jgi:hypothetical protein
MKIRQERFVYAYLKQTTTGRLRRLSYYEGSVKCLNNIFDVYTGRLLQLE